MVASGEQNKSYRATVSGNTWSATLDPVAGGSTQYSLTVYTGDGSSCAIKDVLFGDVWLCSGQSNMAFLLEMAAGGKELVQDANSWPQVRLFTSKKDNLQEPQVEQPVVEQPWSVGSSASVSMHSAEIEARSPSLGVDVASRDDNWLYMSAVCWVYGREISRATGLPVGLVNTNWGGTPIEFWMSDDARAKCASTSSEGQGGAYNGMITPLLNMTIHGVIWYQGESNQNDALDQHDAEGRTLPRYACSFPAMIHDWRAKWHESTGGLTSPEFPFGFVQLAAWDNNHNPAPAGIRWAQRLTLNISKTFMAVTVDLGDHTSPYGSIHIRDKLTVGQRLALGGQAIAYDKSSVFWTGPMATHASLTSSGVKVSLENVGEKGFEVRNASVGWELCSLGEASSNADCSVYLNDGWTSAIISEHDRQTLTIAVTQAVTTSYYATVQAVRYAWADFPCEYQKCSVYSVAEQLPLGPFVLYTENPLVTV